MTRHATARAKFPGTRKPAGSYAYSTDSFAIAKVYPATGPGAPLVLCFAEGGWHEQGIAKNEVVAQYLSEQGFCAMSVQVGVDEGALHDPAQPPAFPRQIEEVEQAVKWAKENAVAFGAAATRCCLVGGSAGAHVAPMAAINMNAAKGAAYIKAVACAGGLYNLETLVAQSVAGEFNILSLAKAANRTKKELEEWEKGTLAEPKKAELTAFLKLWSPQLHLAVATCPKLYIARSETEGNTVPIAQTDAMVTAAEAAGVETTKRRVLSAESGFKGHAYGYWGTIKTEVAAWLLARV